MNTQTKLSASRLIVMTLACLMAVCLAACGGDDDEPTVDELLSEETTPIDFQLADYYRYDKYYLFDYAGSRYIGSDTISSNKCSKELRQGKHHLLWIKGIEDDVVRDWRRYGNEYYGGIGVHYNPSEKTIINFSGYDSDYDKVMYAELDMEVTPYLVPTRKVELANYVSGSIQVEITDMSDDVEQPRDMTSDEGYNYSSMYKYSRPLVGTINGYPVIQEVSLTGDKYIRNEEDNSSNIILQYYGDGIGGREFYIKRLSTFCPKSGLHDIQLTATVVDKNGNSLPTTSLPRCSMQRGYTTVLRGPLFSGSTADWVVTMEPYD